LLLRTKRVAWKMNEKKYFKAQSKGTKILK